MDTVENSHRVLPRQTSPLAGNAHLTAHFQEGTGRASGSVAGTDMFAEWDEPLVDFHPVSGRQNVLQRLHRAFGRPGADISPPIADPVNVDVDADPLLIAGDSESKVGALRPNSRK